MIKLIRTHIHYYKTGRGFVLDKDNNNCGLINKREMNKSPKRHVIINHILSLFDEDTNYLEIGLRDPKLNFDKINATKKYSVDPGIEFKNNPADFKMTSDEFYSHLDRGLVLSKSIKFDLIFIDGLHASHQVAKDIENSLKYIKDNGFIIVHDCNPPTEWHTREKREYFFGPAKRFWNGTTWKAFVEIRKNKCLYSCCIDTDWGLGVISKSVNLGPANTIANNYFEFLTFDKTRRQSLNLISYDEFKKLIIAAGSH